MKYFLSIGILSNIIDAVYNEDLISDDAFLAWQQCTDPAETALGHSIAVTSLTSFFVNLREIPDESSEEAWDIPSDSYILTITILLVEIILRMKWKILK